MHRLGFLLLTLLIFSLPLNGISKTIHVPGDAITIQGGINQAVNSDTVLIADGIYKGFWNRDLDFKGKAIVVTSENGPEFTRIDCEGSESSMHRGFILTSGETASSVISGLTIENGYYEWEHGGGIYCEKSSPTITHCIFRSNTGYYGGAVYCLQSEAVIKDNLFIYNTALGT